MNYELEIMNTAEIAGLTNVDLRTLPNDLKKYCKVNWVSVESIIKRIREIGQETYSDEDGVTVKYWHMDELDYQRLIKELKEVKDE